ncbi:hypothetical protein [Uliginosibacterium sp. H1]|uniref:hypothetical protein n=1 Tax=Uliginosibacterium sp. H1 TaxID=3114757 RepID=UPI002E19CE05|nr:hypothetical protein [Uliginosibacterium sp. H1]
MALSARAPMLRQVAAGLFMLLVVSSAAAACYLWQLRCENFGCTGLGIAWAMWAGVLYAPGLILGLVLRFSFAAGPRCACMVHYGLLLHVLLGVSLAAYHGLIAP